MAFLQSDIPPSTAPVKLLGRGVAVAPSARAIAGAKPPSSRWLIRASIALAGGALLVIPGYVAAKATDSLAMGILATDIAFLLAVASWSSVAGNGRR